MFPTRYRMLKDSDIKPEIKAGTIVYECTTYDCGLSAEDTERTGRQHMSVTLDPTGDYPFFTVPEDEIEELTD